VAVQRGAARQVRGADVDVAAAAAAAAEAAAADAATALAAAAEAEADAGDGAAVEGAAAGEAESARVFHVGAAAVDPSVGSGINQRCIGVRKHGVPEVFAGEHWLLGALPAQWLFPHYKAREPLDFGYNGQFAPNFEKRTIRASSRWEMLGKTAS
jgi:hypothetical protein